MKNGIIIALMAITVLLVGGCGGGGGKSDESRIRGRYSSLANAMHRERIDEVMYLFSPDYLDAGYNYVDVRNAYAELFDEYNNIDVTFSHLDVRVYGNDAQVSGHQRILADDTFDNNQPVERDMDFTDYFRYEHGDWFFYGNQQSASATAKRAPFRFSPEAMKAK
ncbi:MAG TPA: nuclear transport factor 2 family protein [Armatimonadota bacterium]|jgi:hypothetical protein